MRGVRMARVNSITFIPSRWQSFCATGDQSHQWKHFNPPQQLATLVRQATDKGCHMPALKIELPGEIAVREMHFCPGDRPTLPPTWLMEGSAEADHWIFLGEYRKKQ